MNKFMRHYLFISFACVQSPDLDLHCVCPIERTLTEFMILGLTFNSQWAPKSQIRHNNIGFIDLGLGQLSYFRAKIAFFLEARFLPIYYVYLSLI